jgi:hypothetical protein
MLPMGRSTLAYLLHSLAPVAGFTRSAPLARVAGAAAAAAGRSEAGEARAGGRPRKAATATTITAVRPRASGLRHRRLSEFFREADTVRFNQDSESRRWH